MVSYPRIRTRIDELSSAEKTTADIILELGRYFKKNTSFCYGGIVSEQIKDSTMSLSLLRESCSMRDGTPLYLTNYVKGKCTLSAFREPEWRRVSISHFNFMSDHWKKPGRPGDKFKEGEGIQLSPQSYKIHSIKLRIKHPTEGGFLFGYQDENNFFAYVINEIDGIGFMNKKNGMMNNSFLLSNQMLGSDEIELMARFLGSYLYLFRDGVVWLRVEPPSPMGRVGIYHSNRRGQSFSDLYVSNG